MGLVLALFPGRFFHVMEVSLTLVSYTHFILVCMDVCGSTYGNSDW